MTGFFALLRLQLLSRFANLKPRNLRNALKEKKRRTIGMAVLILFLVVYLGSMLYIVETKMLDIMMRMNAPDMLITMAVMLATVGTLLMSFFFVLSSLYLGRDAAYLAALPLKPRTIMSAKLVQVWISETCIDAISRSLKQKGDAIEQFRKAGREDLVEEETLKSNYMRVYLPEPLSEAELEEIVKAAIAETGATSRKDMGAVMKAVGPRTKGRADGRAVSGMVQKLLVCLYKYSFRDVRRVFFQNTSNRDFFLWNHIRVNDYLNP